MGTAVCRRKRKMFLLDIITNPILITSASAWVISQVIKAIIDTKAHRSIRVLGHGGMPSSHTATMTSLTLITGLRAGFDTPVFAVAAIVMFIVMCDAAGVRNETAKHSATIKELAESVNGLGGDSKDVKTENLVEFIGHTPFQVAIGALVGISTALISYLILGCAVVLDFSY